MNPTWAVWTGTKYVVFRGCGHVCVGGEVRPGMSPGNLPAGTVEQWIRDACAICAQTDAVCSICTRRKESV